MKKLFFFVIALLFFSLSKSQNLNQLEFFGRPYFIQSDSTMKSLERADALIKVNSVKKGYGGSEVCYSVSNASSQILFPSIQNLKFYFKFSPNIDPSEVVKLIKGDIVKDKREFLFLKTKFNGEQTINPKEIKLSFKKISEGFYEVTTVDKLEQGEYAFMPIFDTTTTAVTTTPTVKISCFGVK